MRAILVCLSVFGVLVSNCPNGTFQCTSGECLPVNGDCDFKADCKDVSDEEFYGSCDFEQQSCGWNDTSKDQYSWKLAMANITSIPGQDHTTGTPWGHFMHINGTPDRFNSEAVLQYVVDHPAAIGCQIRFWYYIYDTFSVTSSLHLKLIRGHLNTELLRFSKPSKGWKNATAFIGNQPGGYKLVFSFKPSSFSDTDVFLDDILLDHCTQGDIPSGSDQLSCDFEEDTCAWFPDYSANLTWKRANQKSNYGKDEYDHTTGTGYYMSISAKNKLDPSSTARLISYPQPAGQVMCVSFWYRIYGNSIGSLRFITKQHGEKETVNWMRSGTQGNKWRFADLTFSGDLPTQFILEAVVGGTSGSISIDDVVVMRPDSGSCPAERECTFQGSLCGLLPDPYSGFTWTRTRGPQMENSSGPALDHTLGTEFGYYLSAQLWRYPEGSRGSMVTDNMEATPRDGECWMFWYHMEGRDVGELSLYLQIMDGGSRSPVPLWSRSGDQGGRWRHGRATVLSPQAPYKVIFEAVVGDGPKRDIAIDDLTLHNGPCPPAGFCDFEVDFCGWLSNPPPVYGVNWDWWSGSSGQRFSPMVDHTTNSALGHYTIFQTEIFAKKQMVQLQSEFMEAVDSACLEFWYFMEMWSGSDEMELVVLVNETSGVRSVWRESGNKGSSWHRARVDYTTTGRHQIFFEAKNEDGVEGGIALDDVHIMLNVSCADLNLTTTPAPTTSPLPPPASPMDCNFEQGLCDWVQETSDEADWLLQRGSRVKQVWEAPLYDHTVGNDQGFYLVLNGSGSLDGETALLSVPVQFRTSEICVRFWYYMMGPSISSLDLLLQTKSSTSLVWTRQGTQDSEWTYAQVNISTADTLKLMFSGSRNRTSRGFISIDDVTVKEGNCVDQSPCGFDSGWCRFEPDVTLLGRWGRQMGTRKHPDHTYRTDQGYYLTVPTDKSKIAQLLTPRFPATTEMCLRFWYWLPSMSSDVLSVHVLWGGDLGAALWERSGGPSAGWEVAEITVSSPDTFQVVFRAVHSAGLGSSAQLDDVSMGEGACTPTGSCDFESGQCTWVNLRRPDGHDWVQADGRFPGPATDHTTQTPEGGYLLSAVQLLNPLSQAQVISEWILTRNSTCLTFWYQMEARDSGALRVYVRSELAEDQMLFETSVSGPGWNQFSKTVEKDKPFQVLIEAKSSDKGFIAIDDVTVSPGVCQANVTIGDFAACTFEDSTCGWQDNSVGQFQWLRGGNGTGTEDTGPSVDHTLGTELGWFMAVEADRGEQNSYASLHSPIMEQASSTCVLQFYFHMYGEGIGELKVLLKEGSRTTPLWWLSGNQGDQWHGSEVLLGRTPRRFTVLFEATRTFSQQGDIAIDDLFFLDCSLPEPQPSCPAGMFTCVNGVCVDRSRLCDFTDDCGDESDEVNCGEQGVKERCSFEQGLCSWSPSETDTPGPEWTIQDGEAAWPTHGPPRDHTQNTAAGHYVIPGMGLSEQGQTSEIQSSTLLPSSNCTVRFYYYSHGDDAAASLTMRQRWLQTTSTDSVMWIRDTTWGYSWKRVEATFSSTASSKMVLQYKRGTSQIGLVAVDDISFSNECIFDPDNGQLPGSPCQDEEFFCWRSEGITCVPSSSQCDYQLDCPQGEDEDICGPCTFESGQCQWSDVSVGAGGWQSQSASNLTVPPTDHTTGTGHYMTARSSQEGRVNARLESPALPPSSPYCQILFHFHMSGQTGGAFLAVLRQQVDGTETTLWSRLHHTRLPWTPEVLALGQHPQPYRILFSGTTESSLEGSSAERQAIAVDDISFLHCEGSYKPPALSTFGCSFEEGLCGWSKGAEEEQDWHRHSGPTGTPNTGPVGDRLINTGYYLYIESSRPSEVGSTAQLKSPLLPPAGETGYCLTVWYHMFGATIGSLRILLQTTNTSYKTLVWQRAGTQGDEWREARSHVTLRQVHQVILEATVGGEAGDIAIDDIGFNTGPCPNTDVCDFEEEGSCGWQQQDSDDDSNWVRGSGSTPNPQTGPDYDHTTYTPAGHYYYLASAPSDLEGQRAKMVSPLFPAGKGECVQLWYHMWGKGVGTLNVYQLSEQGDQTLLFSRTGDQEPVWRLAQASLSLTGQAFRIMVEGVKTVPCREGDMAFDDVLVAGSQCPSAGHCDFEGSMCGWRNLGGGVDDGDWLRGHGASLNPNTGPSVDHTTNSSLGYYLYADSSIGEWGVRSVLVSDLHQPTSGGHCLTFWYHLHGAYVGTLNLYSNNRKLHASGDETGLLMWRESGNQGDVWLEASLSIDFEQTFWFVFEYQRGKGTGGDVALDDITILPGPCYLEPPTPLPTTDGGLSLGLGVGLTLLMGVVLACLYVLHKRHSSIRDPKIIESDELDINYALDVQDCSTDGTNHGTLFDFVDLENEDSEVGFSNT